MRKLLAANRNRAPIFITLILVGSLITYYVFVYIPGNEQEIKNQRFRVLQRIDKNIQDKIDNSVSLLDLLFESADNKAVDTITLRNYITGYSKANFILDNIRQEPDSIFKKYKAGDKSVDSTGSITGSDEDPVGRIKVDYLKQQFEVILRRIMGKGADQHLFRISMHYKFDQFVEPVLVSNVFDEYVLLSQKQVVYETFPTGIRYYTSDSLLRSTGNGISSSGIRDQEIGGTQYKMFLQPLMFDKKNDWILAGLLSTTRYENEKKQLSAGVVLLLVTVALAIIVAFPWLKLLHMGNQNRLTLLDGGFSLMVAMLLMSLLFFTFFRYNVPFRARDTPGCKENLATSITQAFTNEVRVARNQLYHFDSLMRDSSVFTDLENVQNPEKIDTGRMNRSDSPFRNLGNLKQSLTKCCKAMSFNQVFWLDSNGYEIYNWTNDTINAPHADLSKRNYFINAKNEHFYFLDGDTSKPFYLDQVISWTTGTFRTQISKKALINKKGLFIVDLSFNVKALDSVIMPVGYSFAVIDNAGKVLYHSDRARNLNENLRDEFSNGSRLMSSIAAHTTDVFVTDYYGKEYNTRVAPMPDLPYCIVILSDAAYKETKDTEIYSFTISMFLLLFLYFVIEAVAVVFFSANRSFLTRRGFIIDWIWPRSSFHRIYNRASAAHVSIIILLLVFYQWSDFANLFFSLPAAVTGISIFLNSLYVIEYDSKKDTSIEYQIFSNCKVKTKNTMIVFLVVLNVVALFVVGFFSAFLAFEAAAFVVLLAFYLTFLPVENNWLQSLVKKQPVKSILHVSNNIWAWIKPRWTYSNSYTLMALTKLIICSGIPVIFLYTLDYNYEQNLLIRYRQVDFANRFVEKFHNYSDSLWSKKDASKIQTLLAGNENGTISTSSFIKGTYNDRSWIKDVEIRDMVLPQQNVKDNAKDSLTSFLLNVFRFYQNPVSASNNNLYKNDASNSFVHFNPMVKESILHSSSSTTFYSTEAPNKYLTITSHSLNYTFPRVLDLYGLSFWLLLLLALIVFYFVLHYIIKTMFAVDLPSVANWQRINDDTLGDDKMNGLLFIIGPPGSGKMKEINQHARQESYTFDMLTRMGDDQKYAGTPPITIMSENADKDKKKERKVVIDKDFLGRYRSIVINNFEYNFKDDEENLIKLELLEILMTLKKKPQIIILSTIHPTGFLDSLHTSNDGKEDYEPFIERWTTLLGHFKVLIWPLQLNFDAQKIHKDTVAMTEGDEELFAEFQFGHFLKRFSAVLRDQATEGPSSDKKADRLQSAVQNYYLRMSDSLTPQQKSSMHEFAKHQAKNFASRDERSDEPMDSKARGLQETVENYYLHMSHSLTSAQRLSLYQFAEDQFVHGGIDDRYADENSDARAYRFQLLVQNYYMHIWHSLTREEKFLLYDLAEDGLVNSNDSYNLGMLISKGIIVRDSDRKLRLFNKSFCNFVLTSIGNIEATKIQNQITDSGHWNRLRVPLMIIIIAILGFLLTTQAETYNKIIAYLGALVTGMLTFSRLFGFFEGKETKSS
jgi:hypothetical protein